MVQRILGPVAMAIEDHSRQARLVRMVTWRSEKLAAKEGLCIWMLLCGLEGTWQTLSPTICVLQLKPYRAKPT